MLSLVALWIISTGCYTKFGMRSYLNQRTLSHNSIHYAISCFLVGSAGCACNSTTERSRKECVTSLPCFHISASLPDVQTSSQVLKATMYVGYMVCYLLTYLLTPWSRVLLEKLTGFAANQENPPAFNGTRRFITAFTSASHPSLS